MYAIIPAKLTSRGCPAKNGRHLGGLPLIAQAIAYARQEGVHPLVATPDGAVAALAQKYDVPVLFEPEKLKDGDTLALIRRVMKQMGQCRYFCLLQPTSPFREPGLLAKMWRELRAKGEEPHAYYTAPKLKLQGRITNGEVTKTLNSPRRQINVNWVYPADGNIFAWNREAIAKEGPELMNDAWEPVTWGNALTRVDIDSEADYELARELETTADSMGLLPSRVGQRVAIVTNCPLWDEDHSSEIDHGYDLVVRINDLRSLDTHCTGTRTDIAYVLPGTNYIANPAENQHGDALRGCRRVVFARQTVNHDESFKAVCEMVKRHGLDDNWSCIEEWTGAKSVNKTTVYEAAYQMTRCFPGCRITIFGDRHAGTRALEHAGNLGEPEDFAMEELVREYGIEWVEPMQKLHRLGMYNE